MELYDLLKKAQNDDKDAIYAIIKDFESTLKKLSHSLHYEEAETDLIIELLQLIQNIDIRKFDSSTHKQIAKYIHIHLRRRTLDLLKKNESKLGNYLEINHDLLADKSILDTETTVFISSLINSLDERQQDIITMKFIYGFSERDIAKKLGISRQAVNRAKNRALSNLKKFLMEDEDESIRRKDNTNGFQLKHTYDASSSKNILYSQNQREKSPESRRKRNKLLEHYT